MPIQQQDTIGDLTKLLGLVKGPSTTTSQSTSSNISAQGMQGLINQILQGSQGLATISQGQKASGLYGSTTNQMLTNDLITQASQKLGMAQAGTTTTSKQKAASPLSGQNLLQMLTLLGGSKLLGPTVKRGIKATGIDDAGEKLANLIFGSGTGSGAGAGSSALGSGAEFGSNISALGSFADPLNAGVMGAGYDIPGTGTASGGLSNISAIAGAGLADTVGGLGAFDAAASTLASGGVGLGGGIGSFAADLGITDAVAAFGGSELAGAGLTTAATAATAAESAGGLAAIGSFLAESFPVLASFFSDERLKTDIKPVGKTDEGQTIYTYKYIDNPIKTHMGVMAQETLKFHPEAVIKHPSGALMVNYDKLLGVD